MHPCCELDNLSLAATHSWKQSGLFIFDLAVIHHHFLNLLSPPLSLAVCSDISALFKKKRRERKHPDNEQFPLQDRYLFYGKATLTSYVLYRAGTAVVRKRHYSFVVKNPTFP